LRRRTTSSQPTTGQTAPKGARTSGRPDVRQDPYPRYRECLWADEGFGVRCVERLAERYRFGPEVHVLDGGTQGLYLLPFLEGARNLLVFDAVDYGLAPGTMKIVEGDEVPAFMGAKKMSLHQTGFQDVIATAQLMGMLPRTALPDRGAARGAGGLRRRPARHRGRPDRPGRRYRHRQTRRLGGRRPEGSGAAHDLADISIRRDAYEAGRPSAEDAYRHGDARFVPMARSEG
jgi:hydrogenase maturation protease